MTRYWSLLRPRVTTQLWSLANGASGPSIYHTCKGFTDLYYFQLLRYVTGVVMEGALRAPGLMADIVQVLVAVNGEEVKKPA